MFVRPYFFHKIVNVKLYVISNYLFYINSMFSYYETQLLIILTSEK